MDIMELKKDQDQLIVEKEQILDHRVKLENVISQVYEQESEAAANEDV